MAAGEDLARLDSLGVLQIEDSIKKMGMSVDDACNQFIPRACS